MPLKKNPAKTAAAMRDAEPATLSQLNAVIAASKPLVPGATRAVLGEGPIGAPIAFVGEQPGDQEDRQGRPFVGPAGLLLDRAMRDAGIDRRGLTSRMRSSISSSSGGESGASTRSRRRARSGTIAGG